jgi:hypothetical protein
MSISVFKCPRFQVNDKRTFEVQFTGVVAAGAGLTLVSNRIAFKFRIVQLKMFFSDEANFWIRHRWFVGSGVSAPTTAPPTDYDVIASESGEVEFTGKGIIRVSACDFSAPNAGMYLKLYTVSSSPYAYTINASALIEEL